MIILNNVKLSVWHKSKQDITNSKRWGENLKTVAIVTRRLKEGKTYHDFRKAWYHTVGFGTPTNMVSAININDPNEIIVIGIVESELDEYLAGLRIDVKERLENPLDDIIEPEIGRTFGIVVAEDDFSAEGDLAYKPPSIDGKETNLDQLSNELFQISQMIAIATEEREKLKK